MMHAFHSTLKPTHKIKKGGKSSTQVNDCNFLELVRWGTGGTEGGKPGIKGAVSLRKTPVKAAEMGEKGGEVSQLGVISLQWK